MQPTHRNGVAVRLPPLRKARAVTLDWILQPKGRSITRCGRYTVNNTTIWQHSRILQERYEAVHDNGVAAVFLGYHPTPRAAIEACEQHHNQKGKHQQ